MTDSRWRSSAKQILYQYPYHLQLIRETRGDQLHSLPACRFEQRTSGSAPADPTVQRLLKMESALSENVLCQVRAVQRLIRALSTGRRLDQRKLAMLDQVYFRRSKSLLAFAVSIGAGERTVCRWNAQVLQFIAYQMGWDECFHPISPNRE